MKAMLVDDAEDAIDALTAKLEVCNKAIDIIGKYTDPKMAVEEIKKKQPDVLFVDVEMPGMDGFTLLQNIQPFSGAVIFVTAYSHYATKAIRESAFDYLEKPVDIQLLRQCVDRLETRTTNSSQPAPTGNADKLQYLLKAFNQQLQKIALPTNSGIIMLPLSDILYMEAFSNYTKFHVEGRQPILVSKTLKDFEDAMLQNNFFRLHRSYLVNLNYITQFNKDEGGYVTLKGNIQVEVSDSKKKELMEKLREMSLV
jgi:two-component system, LytTR family, response regulator